MSSAARSSRSKKSEEIYAWKTLKVLRAELGDALANDLFARHMEVDPRMTGKLLQPHPNFPKVEETALRVCGEVGQAPIYGGDL